MKVKISDIKIGSERRPLNEAKAHEIADSIKELGLLHPIILDKDLNLVAGLHRIEAHKILGRDEIEADIRDYDPLRKELAEIDENLMRSEPHYIIRGEQLKRRKDIYETLYPDSKWGGDRRSDEFQTKRTDFSMKPSFARDTASKTGYTVRTIHQEIQLAKKLTPEVKEKVMDTNLPKAEALRLVRVAPTPKTQEEIVERIAGGRAKTVSEAQKQITREKAIEEGKRTPVELDAQFKAGEPFNLMSQLEPESFNAIITSADEDAANLLTLGVPLLRPGGIMAIKVSQYFLPDLLRVPLPEGLTYLWTLCDTLGVVRSEHKPDYIKNTWSPIVVFIKGDWAGNHLNDTISKALDRLKASEDQVVQIVNQLTKVGDKVLDPLMTEDFPTYLAASIGRSYNGFSLEQATINVAKVHLGELQNVMFST